MKRIVFVMLVAMSFVAGAEVSDKLLDAISEVESGGQYSRDTCIGDNGNAVGRFQIWKVYVDDVNRFSSAKFTYEDRKDPNKSRQMVKSYLTHYGKRYERLTGKKCTDEVYARIHNGGPNGWKKSATANYWKKVQREMNR